MADCEEVVEHASKIRQRLDKANEKGTKQLKSENKYAKRKLDSVSTEDVPVEEKLEDEVAVIHRLIQARLI